jgi:NDP-sugar pyrophosphorylase family protein
MQLTDYVRRAGSLDEFDAVAPWQATEAASSIVASVADRFASSAEWHFPQAGVVVHSTAIVSPSAVIESPAVVGPRTQLSHGVCLRGGVWLEEEVVIGPNCEIKASFVFAKSRVAHLNYVGNSIIGEDVNIEAGAVLANHWNERDDKTVFVRLDSGLHATTVTKFGAVVGDNCRIGANAVTSPGTVLRPGTVVPRLALIDQTDH